MLDTLSTTERAMEAVRDEFPDYMFNHRDLARRAIECAIEEDWRSFEELMRCFFPAQEEKVRQICRDGGLFAKRERPPTNWQIMPGGWRLLLPRKKAG